MKHTRETEYHVYLDTVESGDWDTWYSGFSTADEMLRSVANDLGREGGGHADIWEAETGKFIGDIEI